MIFDDTYKEVKNPSSGIYKEKGSKFISYCFPVYTQKDVKDRMEEVKKIEHSASHYCYAFVLNPDKSSQKISDDGEPSYTAGKPILRQILSNDLTNILIIVVRYFGGVKLGIPGLIRSYKTAATDAIVNSQIITKILKEQFEVCFKYYQMNDVMRLVKEFNLEVIKTDFHIDCKLIFTVAKSKSLRVEKTFKNNHELTIKYLKTS